MARIEVNGLELDYELIGDEGAPPLAITPGGRYPRNTAGVPELARILADNGYRVLMWDRPGCGASDIAFTAPTESIMNADALAGLVQTLGLKNITLLGGSAGSRVSLMAAARMPQNVTKMALWWISGSPIGLIVVAASYTADQVRAASTGGMEAVVKLPSWADQISRNPRVRETLLAQDPEEYIEVMQKWALGFAYREDTPVPGLPPEDIAKLTMPILVFRSGKSDMAHTKRTSEWLAEVLPNSTLMDPPWREDEWNYVSTFTNDLEKRTGRFERWPLMAPTVLKFLKG